MKFRCGVIGLGRIGCGFDDNPNARLISTHVGAYLKHSKTDLISLCDVDKNKLNKYGLKYNIKNNYIDYHDMLKNEKLDCISICTWSESHLEIVEEAIKNNVKGIFLEKPISNSLKNAKKIVDLCKQNNVKLQIDFQRRFDPIYEFIKKIILKKKFGDIQFFNIYYGGGINNTGSHLCDLIRFLFGDIKYVEGYFSNNPSNNKLDPNIDGKIICKNSIKCNLQSFDYSKFGLIEFDVIGTKSRIKMNLTTGEILFFEAKSPKYGLVYNELIPKELKIPKQSSAILNGVKNLIKCIEFDKKPLSSGEDGYHSLEAVISLMISAEKDGKKIEVPFKNNTYKITSK